MMKSLMKSGVVILASVIFLGMAGCASKVRTVPFKIQSDPLGAYVVFQVQADKGEEQNYDWVFLGNTPLDVRRAILSKQLKTADSFVIKVMKEGYIDQQKAWTGKQFVDEAKSKGAVFWNPRLIKSN